MRRAALDALGDIGPASAKYLQRILSSLDDENSGVRRAAAHAIGLIGPDAAKALHTLRKSANDPRNAGDAAYARAVRTAIARIER